MVVVVEDVAGVIVCVDVGGGGGGDVGGGGGGDVGCGGGGVSINVGGDGGSDVVVMVVVVDLL
jgi:hypothetical protein